MQSVSFTDWVRGRKMVPLLREVCTECGNPPRGKCKGCGNVPLCKFCEPLCSDCLGELREEYEYE